MTRRWSPLGLRGALYAVLTARDAAALAEVHRYLAAARTRASWRFAGDAVRVEIGAGPLAAVDAAALAAGRLLEGAGPSTVGRCDGAGCGWLFVGAGRRRWCDMAVRGNRAKDRRFAERRRTASAVAGTRGYA